MTAHAPGMADHPDIVALRARYEKANATPVAQAVDGLTFLAGLYMAISPWVIGFDSVRSITANDLIVGIAYAVVALGLASAYGRVHGIAWVTPLIGVWMIITPWVLAATPITGPMLISNIVAGAVGVVLGLAAMGVGMFGKR